MQTFNAPTVALCNPRMERVAEVHANEQSRQQNTQNVNLKKR